MANIAKLPSGQDIRTTTPGDGEYPYGPHMRVLVKRGVALLVGADNRVVAFTKGAGYSVDLKAIGSGEVTPYVNRFIAGWGKVETYWRTGELRLKAQVSSTAYKAAVPANASVQSVAERTEQRTAPEPVVEPTPIVVATPSVVVATPEVIVEREHDFDPIPTVEPKVKAVRRTIKGTKVVTVGTVTVPERFFDDVEDAWQDRDEDRLAAVLVTGPSGTAKTLFIRAFAAYVGVPFIKVDGGAIRTADDWFGGLKQDPNTKTWAFQYSAFGYALKHGIRCIVLLDEANRSETPQALNAVLGLLDGTKSVYISDAREFLRLPQGMAREPQAQAQARPSQVRARLPDLRHHPDHLSGLRPTARRLIPLRVRPGRALLVRPVLLMDERMAEYHRRWAEWYLTDRRHRTEPRRPSRGIDGMTVSMVLMFGLVILLGLAALARFPG